MISNVYESQAGVLDAYYYFSTISQNTHGGS